MEHENAIKIMLLRAEHKSYGYIAEKLGLSFNTIKSYCLRNDLGDNRIKGPNPARIPKEKRKPHPLLGYCLECGTVFKQNINGNKKFCGKLCAGRWRRKNGKGKYRLTCPICKKEFPVFDDRKPRIYCSQDCYRTARYYLEDPNRTTESTCLVCGKKMIFPGHKKRKFCSPECYHEYQRKSDM